MRFDIESPFLTVFGFAVFENYVKSTVKNFGCQCSEMDGIGLKRKSSSYGRGNDQVRNLLLLYVFVDFVGSVWMALDAKKAPE
jgi:hypothetical protein